MTYYTSSDEKSKLLLFLCRITHQFTMSMQARLLEAKRREEEEERKDQRASFAYSRGVSFDFSTFNKENRNGSEFKDLRSDQRISVISNTSSNTTSGIVSDRVQSLDESEDDLEMEVMINSPPGDSVESLALEHLRDGNQEVDASVVAEAPESDIQRADETPSTSMFAKKSPHSGRGGPTTPATTDGSQCSSSCSTVVVAGPGTNSSTSSSTSSSGSGFLSKNIHGRNSTTSSLELDYSHTAQNSAASESVSCLELNLSTQNDQFVLQAAKSDSETQDSETQDNVIKHLNFEMSNFILGKINQITRKSTFGGEVGSDTESLYSVFNVANSNTYGRCISLGNNENTRQCEVEYSDRTQNGNGSDVDTASSGIFTLPGATEPDLQTNACSSETSGIYGLVNSTVDTSSVSECCGVYAILEPMRNRSGSNASCVSASRSFHGDGSDPSDARMGTLLSAAELSDLIVGKAHSSGTYPSRSTVSHTLDSDSDYVTLPPPPRLPPRNETSSNLKPGQLKTTFSNEENGRYLGSETSDDPNASGSLTSRSLTKRYPNDIYHDAIGNAVEMQGTRGPGPTEEAAARFITTKPHISMITHSNVPPLLHTPNFACPTNSGFHLNYNETNTFSDVLPTRHVNKVTPLRRNGVENDVSESSFSSISILPETNERNNLPPSAGGKLNASKSAAILPVVGNNNYLDVYASRARSVVSARRVTYHRTFSPVPQFGTYPGQPSPVQPPLATVYTSQVARSQIEQFKQQLYSDVDYVIYPMKDPAISKQEYMDAKQGSLLAAMAAGGYPPPPPYPSAKSHVMYRSTPNVGSNYLPIEFVNGQVNRSANQFWPCKANPPTSPMYSVTGPSKSSHGLRYDAVGLSDFIIPHSLSNVPGNALNISRTKSDDNILNASKNCSELSFSYPEVKHRRCQPVSGGQRGPLPATPTSDANFKKSSSAKYGGPCTISGLQNSRYEVSKSIGSNGDLSSTSSATKMIANDNDSRKIVDIHALIEKSKNLDLPLISALCNDRSLIRQTNAFVMPKHPVGVGVIGGSDRTRTSQTTQNWTAEAKALQKERAYSFAADNVSSFEKHENRIGNEFGDAPLSAPTAKPSRGASLLETLFSVKSSKRYVNSSKLKYPVSGLSTTQISKPHKKLSSAHVHPKDSKSGDAGIIRTVKINTKTSAIKKNKDPLVP
ncbi:hypothetical protein RUM43_009619 [Polyplax serrata]|uniref:Uncharacterized protein n=1 Tax=Polyplax serrata TaxID=468196 RepID=A0AAN8RZR0_POLSC